MNNSNKLKANKVKFSTQDSESVETEVGHQLLNNVNLNTENIQSPLVEDYIEDDVKQKLRKRNPENWKQNVRKRNKNKGLEYIKVNGKVSERKKLGPPCTCREKCYSKIGLATCEKIFQNFWKLGDHSLQNAYIAGCVRIFLPKHCYKKDGVPSRRFFSRNFYVTVNGVDTEVCKQAFLNIHAISNGRLDRLLKKKQEIGNTGFDRRGRHRNKVNKIPLEKIRLVRRHIDSIRKKAGYVGKRKSKKVEILSGALNIRTMYKLYKEEMLTNGVEPVCEYRYRKIFHTDFHLDFGRTTAEPKSVTANGKASVGLPNGSVEESCGKREQNLNQNEYQESQKTKENDKKVESLMGVSLNDLNLNVPMAQNVKNTTTISPFVQLDMPTDKEFQIRTPESTSYVLAQEVFRLDYPTNFNGSHQTWIFSDPS